MSVTFSHLGKLGRFGNQLWQLAATIGYAQKYNVPYFIPKWEYSQFFKYGFQETVLIHKYPVYREKAFSYNRIPKYSNIDLFGYFQSIKYWDHCEAEIRKLLTPNDEIKSRLDQYRPVMEDGSCAVHIRRTDYLALSDYHNVLSLDYYKRAMDEVKAKVYIVFSDDPAWCKEQFGGSEDFIFINSGNDLQDFFIATTCKDFIIANSSYSWWFSYLASHPEKRVIAPQKDQWFGKAYSMNSVEDLYLPNWKLI